MRIGILVTTSPKNGGTHYYSLSVLNALRDYGYEHEYVLFYQDPGFPAQDYSGSNWSARYLNKTEDGRLTSAAKALTTFGVSFAAPLARGRYRALLDYHLDLVICPSTNLSAWWCGLPFVVAIHDLWHRYNLPGTSRFNEPFRDRIWQRAAREASIILVESELGREEVAQAYHVPESKILILPTGPAPFIWSYDPARISIVRRLYNLPETYVFYPGGLTPAKNQRRVIEAISILRKNFGVDIHAVFVGPAGEYVNQLKVFAQTEAVSDLVHFLGIVDNQDMPHLYQDSLCLTMASYIGPTNMPIYEAFAVGCPVISSNAGSMTEQVGGAGLMFDPSDAGQLADSILRIYRDREFSESLIKKGFERVESLRPEKWASSLFHAISAGVN